MEAELARDATRLWRVLHPNNVVIYQVFWLKDGHTAIINIGA